MRLDVRSRQRKIGRIDPDLPVMGEFSRFSGERREEDETQLLLKGFDRTRKDRLPVIVVFEHVTDADGKRRVAAVDAEIFAEAEVREAALSAAPILDVGEVEDWGCGKGGFSHFCLGKYLGIDGSDTPFAIRIRHVLEHNYDWEAILAGAVESFQKKLCLILFTPFAAETRELSHNREVGIDAPNLSLARADIEAHFDGLSWRLIPDIRTPSQFGIEHVYLVWRGDKGYAP